MRILFFTNLHPTQHQPGRGTFGLRLVEGLRRAGHEVQVVIPLHEGDAPPAADPRALVVRWFRPPRIRRDLWHHWMWWTTRRRLREVARDFRPELVWSTWVHPDAAVGARLAAELGVPAVTSAVGSDLLQVNDRRRQRVLGSVLRQSAVVFTDGNHLRVAAVALGADPRRTFAIRRGVDTGRFSPGSKQLARTSLGLDPSTPMLLTVGNLVWIKGIDILLESLALPPMRDIPWCWVHLGDGPARSALERQIHLLGLADRCRFVGRVEHDVLPRWYRAADLQVLPSRSEGIPNVLTEGMACGLPFVASDVGGVPEIAPDPAWCVPPENPPLLADGIARALARLPIAVPAVPRSEETIAAMLGMLEPLAERR